MPQTKARLPKGNHKILNAKGGISKTLKVKGKLLRSSNKLKAANPELSRTPKDNSSQLLSKTSESFNSKKDIPHVEPINQVLDAVFTDTKKIQLDNNKESSDNLKILVAENNSQCQNNLSMEETVNSTNLNSHLGSRKRKRRKPFAHINENDDYSLLPIVLIERLSIDKIEQSIFTSKEKTRTLNSNNDLPTQISENINPGKRRKKSLHQSSPTRKSQSNLEKESATVGFEKESLIHNENSDGQDKSVNLEKKSTDKLTQKSALNKDKAEKIQLEQSQSNCKIDSSQSGPKNEKKTEFQNEKHEDVSQVSRKASLRQRNQNTVNDANGISQNEHNNEKRLTESTSTKIQKPSTSRKSKTKRTDEQCLDVSIGENRKNKPEIEKYQSDHDIEKITNKLEVEKAQNVYVSERSQNESKNEKFKNKSVDKKLQNISISTRSKNKSTNEKEKNKQENEDRCKSKSIRDKLQNEKNPTESISEKRVEAKSEECQSELKVKKCLKDCISENIGNKLENEESQNTPATEKSQKKNKKEKYKMKSEYKKIQNVSASARDKRELDNKKRQITKSANENDLNEKEKNKNSFKDAAEVKSTSSQVKLVNEKCQNEPENFRENILNKEESNIGQENSVLTSDAIKSEVESDDDHLSEENEILNVKIFEIDNTLNFNEEDLVSSQLKESMRVESEPFKNNEIVKVKIFQIENPLDIDNRSNHSCIKETLKDQIETEVTATNNEFHKTKSKHTEIKKISTTINELIEDKSKDTEEETLIGTNLNVDDQEKIDLKENENEKIEIQSDALTNNVVIKVKIVEIDRPLNIEDYFSQTCVSKTPTLNDEIDGEKVRNSLSYLLSSDMSMGNYEKHVNGSSVEDVNKTVTRITEIDRTVRDNDLTNDKLKNAEEETLINSYVKNIRQTITDKTELEKTNYNDLSDENSKGSTDNSLINKCGKLDNYEKNMFLEENEKMEIENEMCNDNAMIKIKVFDNDKSLNIEDDFFHEACIKKTLKDKKESLKITTNIQLSNDILNNVEEKILINYSDTTNVNKIIEAKETEEKELSTDSCSNIVSQTMKDTIEAENLKLKDFCAKDMNKTVKDKIEKEKTENSNKLSEVKSNLAKEKMLTCSSAKSISNTNKDQIITENTKSVDELRHDKSKTIKDKSETEKTSKNENLKDKFDDIKEIASVDSRAKNSNKNIKYKIEVVNTINNKDLSINKLIDTEEKSSINSCPNIVSKIVKNNIEPVKTNAIFSNKISKAIKEKSLIDSCLKVTSDGVKNKIEEEKAGSSNELHINKSIDIDENISAGACAKNDGKSTKNKIEAEEIKISNNELNNGKSIANKEKSLVESCVKSTSTTVNDKIDVEKTAESDVLDKVKAMVTKEKTIDTCAKNCGKTEKIKTVSEKTKVSNDELSNRKSMPIKEKSLVESCVNGTSITVKDKVEVEKTADNDVLNKGKSIVTKEKTMDTCAKNFSKSEKTKIVSGETKVSSNELSNGTSMAAKEKSLVEKSKSITVKDKVEVEKTAESDVLDKDKSMIINEKTSMNTCSVSEIVKDKIETEKPKNSELRNEKSKDTKEISCSKIVDKIVKDKIDAEKTKDCSALDSNKETLTNSCIKSVSKSVKNKIEAEKITIDKDVHIKKLHDSKEKIDSSVKIISETGKIETEKNASSNNVSNDKLKHADKKLLTDSSTNNASKIIKDKIEAEKIINSKDLNTDASKETEGKSLISSTSISNTMNNEIVKETVKLNETSNEKSKDSENKSLTDVCTKSVSENINKITANESTISDKSTEKSNEKSKDSKRNSLTDSCAKIVSETVSDKIAIESATPNESRNEKSKDTERKSLIGSCAKSISENAVDKIEALQTKIGDKVSDGLQNLEEKSLPDSCTKTNDSEKNIGSNENETMEIQSHEILSAQQGNNSVTASTLNNVSSNGKPSKKRVKKKKQNKYRRLKKHMVTRNKKKRNRRKIRSNQIVKSKSIKMMELLGTICYNDRQDKKKCSDGIVEINKDIFRSIIHESVYTKENVSTDSVAGKSLPTVIEKSRICLDSPTNESLSTDSQVVGISVDSRKNKSVPINNKKTNISNASTAVKLNLKNKLMNSSANSSTSNHFKPTDTRQNNSSNQLINQLNCKSTVNFPNQNRTPTQPLQNVVQDEITIEEHEIKVEEIPEVLEIVESEEEPSNINYVTASEILNGINSQANKNSLKAAFLKNLNILPSKKASLPKTNCTNVNNVGSSAETLEYNGVTNVSRNSDSNFYRYMEQPNKFPSQYLHNKNHRDINTNASSSDTLHNNIHRNNGYSMNIYNNSFNDSVANTSANTSNSMSISVREAFEKISSDLLGAYDPQCEIEPQDEYSNGINDLLHISDSDDEQTSEIHVDSDNVDQPINHQQNYHTFTAGNNQSENNSSVFYQLSAPKKPSRARDENMHMMLQCPRCSVECLGMRRLQRHYNGCGVPAAFRCLYCETKLKQKRSLAGHYLSYHADLVSEDMMPKVIEDTVRKSLDKRNELVASKSYTMPSHIAVFCDKCRSRYKTVPDTHKRSCDFCLQPLMYHCDKCKRRQMLSLRVQVHVQSKCSEKPTCPHCNFVGASASKVQEHVLRHHTEIPPEEFKACRHGCGLSFRLQDSRRRHEAHCVKEKDQLCRFCPFKTKHRSVIKVHMQQHMVNNEISSSQAAVLEKESDGVSALIEAYCRICQGIFESPVTSGTRCPRCHGSALYRCRKCDGTDTVYREMRRHVNQNHVPGISRGRPPCNNRVCLRCGQRFDGPDSLKKHQRAIGRCRPSCHRCGKTFLSKESHERHVRRHCGVPARLQCEHCSFITKARFSLVRHMQALHAEVYNGSTLRCPGCGLVFNNVYLFDTHVKNCMVQEFEEELV